MKSKEKGDIALGKAIAYYTEKGIEVLLPIGDKKKYDFVIDNNGFKKVQCKYTSHKSPYGIYRVPLRVMGGNQSYQYAASYKEGDFDLLFVVTADKRVFEIPYEAIKNNKNAVALGKNYKQFQLQPSAEMQK